MMKKLLFHALLLVVAVSVKSEEQKMTQIDIAIKYYQALYSGEHNVVRNFASPRLMFEDPTAPYEFGIPPQINGLDDFLTFMKTNLQGTVDITFTDKYASNNIVVLTVATKGTIPASRVSMGKTGTVEYASQGVSIIHIVDGKIERHTDYFNYPALANSFKRVD